MTDGPGGPIALQGLRGLVAQRMHASLRDMAQYTLFTDADVTDLVGLRAATAAGEVSYNDFVLVALARTLRSHPRLNAYLVDGCIHIQPEINLGIAVALDEGVMIGVVRNAAEKTLTEIAAEGRRVVAAIRAGDRSPSTILGSTFTVTNLGPYGIDTFTPVVNPPEVGILGVGRVRPTPEPDGPAGVRWRQTLPLSLTVDHRAIDGVPAARFLADLVETLGHPHDLPGAAPPAPEGP